MEPDTTESIVPNHHARHRGFSGPFGLFAAVSMIFGRQARTELAIDLAQPDANDHVVDVGCGPGAAARRAARIGSRVTGIDPAPVMLRVARLLGGRRVTYRSGSAESLPLPDADATVVWAISSVHHWPDLAAATTEVSRVLEVGGRFVAVERLVFSGARGHASHGWTDGQSEAFASALRIAGFLDVRVVRSDPARRRLVGVVARKQAS